MILQNNLKPQVVGGYNSTSVRSLFDLEDKNLILVGGRQLFYYNIKTCEEVGRAGIDANIVSGERIDDYLYLFANNGKIFVWDLDSRDWINKLSIPIKDGEALVSCKLVSKRQFIFTTYAKDLQQTSVHYSTSRSERESPKKRETISECSGGHQHMFDVGCIFPLEDSTEGDNYIVYINENGLLDVIKLLSGGELSDQRARLPNGGSKFCCVRANPSKSMFAAGDERGRIFLYTGDFMNFRFTRTKLHWHTLPVNDLCFSSTGNTLFSVGGESGCVVVWDLTANNLGQKRVYARLGMPIRLINCSKLSNQLVLSTEDNEVMLMDTNGQTSSLKTMTKRTLDMYLENNHKALREGQVTPRDESKSVGMLWHPPTDTVVTNSRTGCLQFYSPRLGIRVDRLNLLKSDILSLESESKVVPSDITRAAFSTDGQWLAFYETRDSKDFFPTVKLHIWQRSHSSNKFSWVQTADRLHDSTAIADLRFSPDNRFLVSVGNDGLFHILHRICLDAKLSSVSKGNKLLYAKGFVGSVPERFASLAAFSRDSSVLAISLSNDTTLVWQIVDPYKLVYECQLSRIDNQRSSPKPQVENKVLGLHFGCHKPAEIIAPLCEVRQDAVRIWNILKSEESLEYFAANTMDDDTDAPRQFTSAAFDDANEHREVFAVSSSHKEILLFNLELAQGSLNPLIIIDAHRTCWNPEIRYSHMCFLKEPISDIDAHCLPDRDLIKTIGRLCLMNNHQELVSITDKLTLERKSASNSCNNIRTLDSSDFNSYFISHERAYNEEKSSLGQTRKIDPTEMTDKQRKIRNRVEVQKMLKDLLIRIPSHNLPQMDILGPMILDKLLQ